MNNQTKGLYIFKVTIDRTIEINPNLLTNRELNKVMIDRKSS